MKFPKLLTSLVATLGCIPIAAQCGTSVSGAVNSTTWTTAGSPYCVSGTVAVANLTINPGVEIRLAPNARLQVSTWMRAIGTRAQPIVFSAANLTAGRWGSIVFQGPVPSTFRSNLEWCRIEGAGDSGVTILDNDNIVIRNCRIVNNQSAGVGGACRIANTTGSLTIENTAVERNLAARSGGGIHASLDASASLLVRACRLSQNAAVRNDSAGTRGGGLTALGGGRLAIEGCLIERNTVRTQGTCAEPASGGGVGLGVSNVVIRNSSISSNFAESVLFNSCGPAGSNGAGIEALSTVLSLEITNCVITCNETSSNGVAALGSGLYTAATTCVLNNTTVARNRGSNSGIHVAGGVCNVRNSILYFNTGSQITGPGTITVDYSNVQGGVTGGTGNFNFSPAFAGAGCDPEDFGLLEFSPCVDAGDPDRAFNDGCSPPARGTVRNDMGAQGGPGACDFLAPVRIQCAVETYGEIAGTANTLLLDWVPLLGPPTYLGEIRASRAMPNGLGVLLVGTRTGAAVFGDLTVLLDATQPIGTQPFAFDATGGFRVPVPLNLAPLAGRHIVVQVIDFDPNGPRASNGLRISPCY